MGKIQTTAPVISRQLKAAGFGIVSSSRREGIRVSRSIVGVSVTAQFDSDNEATRRATTVAAHLRELGYTVRQNEQVLTVTAE